MSLEHSTARRQHHSTDKPRRFIRPKEAWTRLAVSRSTFYSDFVATGRVHLFPLGARAKGVLESDVEQVIDEIISGDNTAARSLPLDDWRSRQRAAAPSSPTRPTRSAARR